LRGCRIFRLCPARGEELKFAGGKLAIFAGIAVDRIEQYEIAKTDKPRRRKTPAPAKMQDQQADEGDSNSAANFAAPSVMAIARLLSARPNQ